jgi:hemolysin activation/secretion protein
MSEHACLFSGMDRKSPESAEAGIYTGLFLFYFCTERSMHLRSQATKITLLFLLSALFCTQNVWAESLTPGENQELNRRSKEEAQQRQDLQRQKDVFLQKDQTKANDSSLPVETPSFLIHSIKLEGEKLGRFPWLLPILNQYAERRVGKAGINQIVKRLTNELIDRGYVTTRIVIPEQDISTGKLSLLLVPGIISQIRFDKPDHSGNWHNAFPTRPGNILNLRDLEQGLEQLKRVPSQDADFKIVPGKKPGESEIVISMKESNYARAVFSLDDSGSKETGKLQSSVTIAFDNPFSANDLFNVSFNKDADQENSLHGTDDYSLYYSFPCGNWTFSLSKQHHTYHQMVFLSYQAMPYSGDSDSSEVKIDRLLQRNQDSKTHMSHAPE